MTTTQLTDDDDGDAGVDFEQLNYYCVVVVVGVD